MAPANDNANAKGKAAAGSGRGAGDVIRDATRAQRQGADPALCAWVAASAGSGKTKVLGDRVLRLLLDGVEPGRILCLTFTKAAAAEMSTRIAGKLARWAAMEHDPLRGELDLLIGRKPSADLLAHARTLFARVLDVPGGMKIQTLHAFCQSLLRRFPLEAALPPHFQLIEDRDAAETLQAARDSLLVAARQDPAGLGAALAHVVGRMGEGRFIELLGEFLRERGRLADLEARMWSTAGFSRALAAHFRLDPAATRPDCLTAACADGAFDRLGLTRAARALAQGAATDQGRAARLSAWIAGDSAARIRDFDGYLTVFFTAKGEILKRLASNGAVAAMAEVETVLRGEATRLAAVLEELRSIDIWQDSVALATLALDLSRRYTALKAAGASLDYDDLILKTRDLLSRPGIAPWVLYKLDGGIDHVLVDEAQDTNPEQWQVVKALTAEFFSGLGAQQRRRTVFAVGDRKQSIFSFQRADPQAFQDSRAHFHDLLMRDRAPDDQRPPFVDVALNISFRSTAAVLKLVDRVLAGPAGAGVLEQGEILEHRPQRLGAGGSVEVWPLCTPLDVAEPEPWAPPVVAAGAAEPWQRLAAAVADDIAAKIAAGDRLLSKDRPVRAGDFLVLVRSRNAFVPALVRELKAREVPVSGVDRLQLLDEIAVQDLIAFAEFLLLPEDDLTLAALLKSPLIGLGETELFELCIDREGASVWAQLNALAPGNPRFAEARDRLGHYLARADYLSPFALFAELLAAGEGRRRLYRRLGAEVGEAIDEFLSLALAYETANTPSLQGFLHWLRAGEIQVKRELSDSAGGQVRIMTVHGAKGLQAPIVYLADYRRAPSVPSGLFWIAAANGRLPVWSPNKGADIAATTQARNAAQDRQRREENRLLYVALTRAEDRLTVCGWEGLRQTQEPSWHDHVQAALAALPDVVTVPGAAAGWQGDHLRYAEPQTGPIEDLKAQPGQVVDDGSDLPPWAISDLPPEPEPTIPLTPSRPSGAAPAILSPIAGAAGGGQRFQRGLIVHHLLELLPDLPAAERRPAAERYLARPVHGLDAAGIRDILDEVLPILAAPEFADLFAPGSLAEVPVVAELKDAAGRIHALTGQIDRLVVRPRECVVIDYKSNRPPPMQPEHVDPSYLRQLAAYRSAISRVYPDKSISCMILWSAVPRLMPIPEALLAPYDVLGARLDRGVGAP